MGCLNFAKSSESENSGIEIDDDDGGGGGCGGSHSGACVGHVVAKMFQRSLSECVLLCLACNCCLDSGPSSHPQAKLCKATPNSMTGSLA